MIRNLMLALAAAALVLAAGPHVNAKAPVKIDEVAPLDDLTAEVAVKLADLEELLGDAAEFEDDADKIRQAAGLLACLAQAIAEHSESDPLKAAAPDLRDAAIAIARAETHAAAKEALAKAQTAGGGEPIGNATVEFDWGKLSKMHPLMEEFNARGARLRRGLRRLRDPEETSRQASDMAVMALAVYADTHEVKNKADLPAWRQYALELQQSYTKAAAAIKKKDREQAIELLRTANETCTNCHEKFGIE